MCSVLNHGCDYSYPGMERSVTVGRTVIQDSQEEDACCPSEKQETGSRMRDGHVGAGFHCGFHRRKQMWQEKCS